MTLSELVEKLKKGDKPNDDELDFLAKCLPSDEADAKAAAARRKAEDEVKALKAKIAEYDAKAADDAAKRKAEDDAKLTEAQKKEKAFAALSAEVEKLKAAKAESEAAAARLMRSSAIDKIRARNGITLREDIDPNITQGAFAAAFDGLEDLSDETEVANRVKAFREANTGLIIAKGQGSGLGGKPGAVTANPFAKDTFNLTEQLKLSAENPQLAAQLESAAKQ